MRGVIGALFVGHGTQKLFGWSGGPGLQGISGMMESLRVRPPKRRAMAAGLSETVGGTLLVRGALTPFATTALTRPRSPPSARSTPTGSRRGSYLATSPVVNEEPAGEPTGRFTRVEEPVATR